MLNSLTDTSLSIASSSSSNTGTTIIQTLAASKTKSNNKTLVPNSSRTAMQPQTLSPTAVSGPGTAVHPLQSQSYSQQHHHHHSRNHHHSSPQSASISPVQHQTAGTVTATGATTGTTTPVSGPPHFVDLHVNPGESVSLQFYDGNETILCGPTTIKMVSNSAYPPMALPVQVPPGHMIQQIVDENGTLRHIVLSALSSNGTGPAAQQQHHPQAAPAATYPSTVVQQHSSQPTPFCCCCLSPCPVTPSSSPLVVQPTHLTQPPANSTVGISHHSPVPGPQPGTVSTASAAAAAAVAAAAAAAAVHQQTPHNTSPLFVPNMSNAGPNNNTNNNTNNNANPSYVQQRKQRSTRNLFVPNSIATVGNSGGSVPGTGQSSSGAVVNSAGMNVTGAGGSSVGGSVSKRSNTFSSSGYYSGANNSNSSNNQINKPISSRYSKNNNNNDNLTMKSSYGTNTGSLRYGTNVQATDFNRTYSDGNKHYHSKSNPAAAADYYSASNTYYSSNLDSHPTPLSGDIPYSRDFIIPKISVLDSSAYNNNMNNNNNNSNNNATPKPLINGHCVNSRLNGIKSQDNNKKKKTKDYSSPRMVNNNNINNHYQTNIEPKNATLYTANNNNNGHDSAASATAIATGANKANNNRAPLVNGDIQMTIKTSNSNSVYPEYTILTKNSQYNLNNKSSTTATQHHQHQQPQNIRSKTPPSHLLRQQQQQQFQQQQHHHHQQQIQHQIQQQQQYKQHHPKQIPQQSFELHHHHPSHQQHHHSQNLHQHHSTNISQQPQQHPQPSQKDKQINKIEQPTKQTTSHNNNNNNNKNNNKNNYETSEHYKNNGDKIETNSSNNVISTESKSNGTIPGTEVDVPKPAIVTEEATKAKIETIVTTTPPTPPPIPPTPTIIPPSPTDFSDKEHYEMYGDVKVQTNLNGNLVNEHHVDDEQELNKECRTSDEENKKDVVPTNDQHEQIINNNNNNNDNETHMKIDNKKENETNIRCESISQQTLHQNYANDDESEESSDEQPVSAVANDKTLILGSVPATKPTPQRSPRHLYPKIEAISLSQTMLTHNACKLKWCLKSSPEAGTTLDTSPSHGQKLHFVVEMILPSNDTDDECDNPSTRVIYQGNLHSYRATQLLPLHEYSFRVRTYTDSTALISNVLIVNTPEAPVIQTKLSSGRRSKQQLQQQVLQQQQQILLQQQQLRQMSDNASAEANSKSSFLLLRTLIRHWYINPDQKYALAILVAFSLFALVTAIAINRWHSSTST